MSVNKLLPATLVLLALAGSTAMAACTASEQSALDGTIVNLSNTTLKSDNALIPLTASTQTFKSDDDGEYRGPGLITEATSGESCTFGVTCPTGYFVYLNMSGRFVDSNATGTDRIVATGGGKSYEFYYTSGYSHTKGFNYEAILKETPRGIVTAANTLTWTQSTHYDANAYGYQVVAGCTSFVAGTCPYTDSATHFTSLATASTGTSVTLNTELDGPVYNEDGTSTPASMFPVGVNCSWPVTCPSGTEVVFSWSTGIAESEAENPHLPVITVANGTSLSYSTSDPHQIHRFSTGHSAVNINWAITIWNASSSQSSGWMGGFVLSASCEVMATTTAATTTTAASTTVAASGTTAAAATTTTAATSLFSASGPDGSGASVVSFAAAVVAAIVVALV